MVIYISLCGGGDVNDTIAAAKGPAPPLPGAAAVPFNHHIVVDQFGYRPEDRKVAVIRDPRNGYDNTDRYTPGASYQVRRARDGSIAFAGAPASWRSGSIEASSGDSGWWFDFSPLKDEGSYFVYDAERKTRSATFAVNKDVYAPVLKAAMRAYFYQRSGFAKRPPFAEDCWTDDVAFLGRGQDLEARDITDRQNPSKSRNVSGGWFDAGDTNKYVTFASIPVHQLLTAFEENPRAFHDDFGIPESGNGIPDLIDEVKWEIDWLKRMQFPDGSVALKVGTLKQSGGKPSLDRTERFFIPSCSSATIAAAGMFAHAAIRFGEFAPLKRDRADLQDRALLAWKKFLASPVQTGCDNGEVKSGDADMNERDQIAESVVAAIYLLALTGRSEFDDYIRAHYRETRPYSDIGWSRYSPHQGEALLFYARQPGAAPKTAASIVQDKLADVANGNQIYGFRPDDDLYRAFLHDGQYHWGSNQVRANYGNTNLDATKLVSDGTSSASYRDRAEEILHYFHGVNPFAMVYLTNMYRYGATRSVNEIFHSWYAHDTRWDSAVASACGPPPGFVPGGPNASAAAAGVPASLVPPSGQPPQKSYRDWNTPWPDSAWAVTEPGIYYQAAYIRLLSGFIR